MTDVHFEPEVQLEPELKTYSKILVFLNSKCWENNFCSIFMETKCNFLPQFLNSTSVAAEDKGVLLSSDSSFSKKMTTFDSPCQSPLLYPVKIQSVTQTASPVQVVLYC